MFQLIQLEMTKQRQADLLKKQQEKDKAQAQASKDKPDNANRSRAHKSKGKASHPDQIKSCKRVAEQLEHIMIICYHMIPNLKGTPKMKIF